jgi:hypothetical protein
MGIGKYTHPKYWAKSAVNAEGQERAAKREALSASAWFWIVVSVMLASAILLAWFIAAVIGWLVARAVHRPGHGPPPKFSALPGLKDEAWARTVWALSSSVRLGFLYCSRRRPLTTG